MFSEPFEWRDCVRAVRDRVVSFAHDTTRSVGQRERVLLFTTRLAQWGSESAS